MTAPFLAMIPMIASKNVADGLRPRHCRPWIITPILSRPNFLMLRDIQRRQRAMEKGGIFVSIEIGHRAGGCIPRCGKAIGPAPPNTVNSPTTKEALIKLQEEGVFRLAWIEGYPLVF